MNVYSFLLAIVFLAVSQLVAAEVTFNQDVRPILSDKCFHCHGPDSADREAGVRLDTAEGLLTDLGGYFAIVPGKPEKSEVYKRITHQDPEERMPPPKAHKTLTEGEKKLIYDWIKGGAEWQGHWAFEPISKPETPEVSNKNWPQTPIDNFILARLESEGVSPSTSASKERLIRRLSLDLIGLPPTYEQVQQYVNDSSQDAYEKLVDQLLASSAYGEHQAHYWLDAARYADTHGLHHDSFRSIWPYRDWVVDALNKNKPFDQFTVEQLAGDLLPDPSQEQLIATGFSRSNPTTNEGGAIDEEYEAIYAKDRTEAISTVWMGLTSGCAACHDHKFDPISQKEFYQLTAFFRNTTEKAMDGNTFDTPPSISVFNKKELVIKQKIDGDNLSIDRRMDSLINSNTPSIDKWVNKLPTAEYLPAAKDKLVFHLPANEGQGTTITGYQNVKALSTKIEGENKWVAGKNGPALAINRSSLIKLEDTTSYDDIERFSISLWVKVPKEEVPIQTLVSHIDVNGARMNDKNKTTEWWSFNVAGNSALVLTMGLSDKSVLSSSVQNALTPGVWQHVTLQYDGNAEQKQRSFQFYVDGVNINSINKTGVLSFSPAMAASLSANLNLQEVKISLAVGLIPNLDATKKTDKEAINMYSNAPFVAIQDIRIYNEFLSELDVRLLAKLPEINALSKTPIANLDSSQRQLLAEYYSSQISPEGAALSKQKMNLIAQKLELEQGTPVTLVMQEKPDSTPFAHILDRGIYDQKKEKVESAVPIFLPPINKEGHLNRLDLAQWLVRDDHPLTARVTVNRFWQSLFGKGLVETAGDFGSQGTPPSHLQLLDWLAYDFKSSGWNIKQTIKQMVMSATYQQSSKLDKALSEKDPQNLLLARASRIRLDAEVIRDQVLQVSGLLVDKVGGAPVKPYQPDGLWKAVAQGASNTRVFEQGSGDDLYRKSLYTFRKRTASPPGMALFDAPDRESCTVQREQTNTPLQALLLMNDPQFLEAARVMAQKVMTAASDNKFNYLIQQSLGRTPDNEMLSHLEGSFNSILNMYKEDEGAANSLVSVGEFPVDESLDKSELAAWTMLVSQIFNLDEFIVKN